MVGALTGLLLCQLAGEVLARSLGLPVPGPVVGMVLLFAALLRRLPRRATLASLCASPLLQPTWGRPGGAPSPR